MRGLGDLLSFRDKSTALSEKRYVSYLWLSFLNGVTWCVVIIGGLAIVGLLMAVPAQGIAEVYYWLNNAEWLSYDWNTLLGPEVVANLTSSDAKGFNRVVVWLLDTWVSFPMSLLGLAALNFAEKL